jgi:hypothetical protein
MARCGTRAAPEEPTGHSPTGLNDHMEVGMRIIVVMIAVVSAVAGTLLNRQEVPLAMESDASDVALFV